MIINACFKLNKLNKKIKCTQSEKTKGMLRVQNITARVIVHIYKMDLTDQFLSGLCYPFVDVLAKLCP